MNQPAKQYKNRVLSALPKEELDRLTPYLTPMTLGVRTQLLDGRSEYAYFLEDGMASVVLTMADGATVEVGVIGIDGVVGLPILLGAENMPGETFIQVAGSGYRISAQHLKDEFEKAASCGIICRSICWRTWCKAHRTRPATGCIPSASGCRGGF